MASACKKVKNPCKICLGNVTHKSGIKCEGACQSWVHYKCLNFTPGKISDIKHGLIIVSCPCPDCKTTMPKEIVRDEPFSCGNAYCPANIPPKCINSKCPSNAPSPPPGHNSLLARPQQMHMSSFGPCTVDTCKSSKISPTWQANIGCKKNNSTLSMSCCSGGDIQQKERITQTRPLQPPPPCPPPPCPPPPCPPPPPPTRVIIAPPPPSFRHSNSRAAKKNKAAIKAMERMCSTMGQLTCQLNNLMDKMQQALTTPPSPPPPPTYSMPTTNSCSITQLPCCCPGGGQSGGGNAEQSMNPNPCSPPPCCLEDQQDSSYSYDSSSCYCPTNPLRRNDFYTNC